MFLKFRYWLRNTLNWWRAESCVELFVVREIGDTTAWVQNLSRPSMPEEVRVKEILEMGVGEGGFFKAATRTWKHEIAPFTSRDRERFRQKGRELFESLVEKSEEQTTNPAPADEGR